MPTYGIAASGEDYTTIGGAISDTKSGGGNAWNADTDGILTLEIRDNRDYNENQLTMSGWPGTDDAAGHVVFDCAAANRGLGKNDSGKFRLISSTAGHLCLINANFLIIRNWTMDQNSTGSSDECIRFVGNLDRVLIEKSYLECNNTSSQDCIHATATTQTSLYIFDCVVVAGGSSARCTINPQNYTGSNTQTWHVEHVTSYSPVNTSNMGGIGADQVGGSATVNFNVYNCLSFGTGATGEDFPDASSGMNPVGAGNIAADASVDIYGTTDNKDSLTISATDEAATDVLITTEWTDFQVKEGSDQKAASNYFASGSTRDGREDTSKDIAGNDRPGATHSNRTIGAFQVVSGGVTLVVADALQAITADAPTLTQANTLVLADALHAVLADSPSLTQANVLALADTLQAITADAPTLTQANVLAVADALQALSADNVALTQANVLAVQDALQAIAAEVPTLTQANVLAVADALQAIAADNVVLNVSVTLALADTLQAILADSPSLTQANVLAVADALQAIAADNVVLNTGTILVLVDTLQAIAADNVALTQANVLTVSDSVQAILADNVALTQANTLALADALQAITADSPTLTQAHVLNVADTLQTVAAAGVTLTQASTLIVSDALHAMLADNVALVSGGQIGEVIFVVEAVNRTFVVAPRHRIFNVEAVDRIFTLDRYKTRH